jgi:hypothetical protein
MKQFTFILLILSTLFSCKKKTIEKPEIDFSIDKNYTVAELKDLKTSENCSITPYWQGKTFKIKGYFGNTDRGGIFTQGQANTPDALYENLNLTTSFPLTFAVSDSANIIKKIKANPLKNCIIKVSCDNRSFPTNNSCDQVLFGKIEKAEDITIL